MTTTEVTIGLAKAIETCFCKQSGCPFSHGITQPFHEDVLGEVDNPLMRLICPGCGAFTGVCPVCWHVICPFPDDETCRCSTCGLLLMTGKQCFFLHVSCSIYIFILFLFNYNYEYERLFWTHMTVLHM